VFPTTGSCDARRSTATAQWSSCEMIVLRLRPAQVVPPSQGGARCAQQHRSLVALDTPKESWRAIPWHCYAAHRFQGRAFASISLFSCLGISCCSLPSCCGKDNKRIGFPLSLSYFC
jgi:hypothetical protein